MNSGQCKATEEQGVKFVPTRGSLIGGIAKEKTARITDAISDVQLAIDGLRGRQLDVNDGSRWATALGSFAQVCSIFLRKAVLGDHGKRETRLLDDRVLASLDLRFDPLRRIPRDKRKELKIGLYHRAECLTHVGDSQAVRSLTQCGEPMRFAMAAPIDLRNDFDSVSLRRLAKRTRDATQSRRLLALAEVYDGGSRTDASRIGGVGLQIIRDWVLRFNARGPDGLVDGKSPGAPSKLNADHRRALAEVVEAGPVPAVDGVVRWRRKDLARWLLETFAISLDETTVGRELKALGFAKISARPRHYAQNELAVEAFKKTSPPNWRRSGRGSRKASR